MAFTEISYAPLSNTWIKVKALFKAELINILAAFLLLLLAVFLLYPIFAVLIKSIKGPEGFTLSYYNNFVTEGYYYRSLFNTLLLGSINTIICLTAGFCLAYLTTRGPRRLRKPLKILSMLPLVAPPYLFALSLIILFGRNGILTKMLDLNWSIFGFDGVVISQTIAFIPLAFLMIENTFMSLDPNLEESAYDMGASESTVIRTVTIPLLAPGLLKTAMLVFAMTIAEFGNAAILGGRTPFLAPDTYTVITGEGNLQMGSVLSIILIIPCILIFFLHNYALKGKKFTTIGGKPVASEPREISPLIKTLFLIIAGSVALIILTSFVVVTVASAVEIIGIKNTFTLRHILDFDSNIAIYNSVKVSLIAALVGSLIGILLSYVIARGKFFGRAFIEMIALSGFALPGTVIGIGYIFAFGAPPLKLTGGIMILALSSVFRFLAVGVEAGISKLHQLNIEIEEASQDLGAASLTTFYNIVLPIIFPAFAAGFIYIFMTSMVSLSTVVFLITPGFDLAATRIFDAAIYGRIGLASATTIKMILIVILCLVLLSFLSKKTRLDISQKGVG
ncbi:MAG: iron ABC transporter permease [Pseudomonadota bacterium]